MEFSEKIKIIRKHNYLTQEEFAKKVNVSRKTVSGWENNRSYPDKHMISSISQKFDVSEHHLIDKSVENIFDDNVVSKKISNSNIIKYLMCLQIIMLIISYISLSKIFSAPLNSLLLVVNTFTLRKINLREKNRLHTNFPRKNKNHLWVSGFNFCLGILSIMIYLNLFAENLSVFYISGMVIGTILHVIILTFSLNTLLNYSVLYQKRLI